MISSDRMREIVEFAEKGGNDIVCATYGISLETLNRYKRQYALDNKIKVISTDKKTGEMNWREWLPMIKERQELSKKRSYAQDEATISILTKYPCVVIKPISDMHIGSIGVNYDRFFDFTENLLKIPYLFTGLLGDETDGFVSFKSQMPMLSQIISPDEQDEFLASWLSEIDSKILFSCHGNHAEFEERSSARNTVKKILSKNVVYFNGIGICNIKLNNIHYKIVATHTTRYNSSFNLTHGLKQLARKEISDADIYLTGHIHTPAQEITWERGKEQLFMVLGTLKEQDLYSKRYFSYFSAKKDGAIVCNTNEHRFLSFSSLEDALTYAKGLNGE